ncbi:MAG: helix-turn-helix transcriptional regulator, partial [Chloroflexi bacterium]|nr:helix-turn-helix transcriptional regulator [Chloroflexota bacterium]
MAVDVTEEPTRTERKRRAIVEAATTLFLRHGYAGTSMDQVAALAGVSKQTVYKQFADKERLFQAVVSGVS